MSDLVEFFISCNTKNELIEIHIFFLSNLQMNVLLLKVKHEIKFLVYYFENTRWFWSGKQAKYSLARVRIDFSMTK